MYEYNKVIQYETVLKAIPFGYTGKIYLKDAVRWKAAEFNVKGTGPLGY